MILLKSLCALPEYLVDFVRFRGSQYSYPFQSHFTQTAGWVEAQQLLKFS